MRVLKIPFLILSALFVSWGLFAQKTDYDIILSPDAVLPERKAAEILSTYLEKLGYKIRVAAESSGAPAIYVGQSPEIAKMLGLEDFQSLKPEEVILKSCGEALVISGGRPRGTVYAVYTYLEDFLSFRFWSMNEFDTPPKGTEVKLSGIDYRYHPVFLRRAIYQFPFPALPAQWKCGDPEFAAVCRMNSGLTQTRPEFGGGDYKAGFVHTLRRIMPPGKYFKTHPEYFSLLNGKRENNNTQLCLSNKEMRREFAIAAEEYYMKEKGNYAISISQNDNGGWCQCDSCRELLDREKGRLSGVMLDFVNEIAVELEKKHPDIAVETLAYGPTLEPPLVTRPAKNVFIRYCDHIGGNPAYPITHETNRDVLERFLKWSEIAQTMAVWYYISNAQNPLIPQPTMRTYEEDIRFFRDNKVNDVFVEGNPTAMGLGHLNNLQNYILRKMLWNPDLKYADLLKEFTDGYYGVKSGELVRKYIERLHAPLDKKISGHELLKRIEKGYYIRRSLLEKECYKTALSDPDKLFYPPVAVYMNHALAFMTHEDIIDCVRILDEAIASAENETYRERLLDAAFNIRVALLTDYEVAEQPEKYGFSAEQLKELAKETLSAAEKSGEKRYGLKNSGFSVVENQISRLQNLFPKHIPDFLKDVPPQTINLFDYKDWSIMVPKKAAVIDDENAVSHKAMRYINIGPSWALQCRNVSSELRPGKYKFYLRLRMEPKNGLEKIGSGVFFFAGFYTRNSGNAYERKMLQAKMEDFADGQYHWAFAGTGEVSSDDISYFFCDPANHPDVESIIVDQLLVQRIED